MFKTGVEQLSLFMADEAKKYDSPADRIKAAIESQYAFSLKIEIYAACWYLKFGNLNQNGSKKYTFIRDQYIDPLKKAIEDGQTRKYFVANIEARTAATAIFGMVATSALDSAVAGEKSFDKAAKIVTEFAIRGLLIGR